MRINGRFRVGFVALAAGLALGGCGMAETTVTAGAASGAAAREAKEAPRQLDKVKDEVVAAQQADEAARAAAEKHATE